MRERLRIAILGAKPVIHVKNADAFCRVPLTHAATIPFVARNKTAAVDIEEHGILFFPRDTVNIERAKLGIRFVVNDIFAHLDKSLDFFTQRGTVLRLVGNDVYHFKYVKFYAHTFSILKKACLVNDEIVILSGFYYILIIFTSRS